MGAGEGEEQRRNQSSSVSSPSSFYNSRLEDMKDHLNPEEMGPVKKVTLKEVVSFATEAHTI